MRSLWNTSCVPSGDQLGKRSLAGLRVSRCSPPPLASITHTSKFPERFDTNAIRRPSGDHAGIPSNARLFVSRLRPLPAGVAVYTS